jgi:hypothetical protein
LGGIKHCLQTTKQTKEIISETSTVGRHTSQIIWKQLLFEKTQKRTKQYKKYKLRQEKHPQYIFD